MSEPSSAAQSPQKKGKNSPFAGCTILFIYIGIAAVLIGFALWVGMRMEKTIQSFTEETPAKIQTVDTTDKEAEMVRIKTKLDGFKLDLESKKPSTLTLTADELNLAIATFDILKPQRGTLHVKSISDGMIHCDVAYPINAGMKSVFTKELRYMNGQLSIKPELVDGAVFPRVETIQPDSGSGDDVPPELRQQLSETLLHPVKNDEKIGPLFHRLSSVEIQGNQLILKTDPGDIPQPISQKDTAPFIERFMKGFSIVAVIFLVFVAIIIYISRRKAKKS